MNCPSCGHENPDGAKFCMECASPLGAPARPVAEERKVVTALFCDLVGFTAASESADPEDVHKMLAAYFAMARNQIEGHGGVVEKFIGDAVVGVFGVPAAHEDDPERAVRAGLRIVEDAEELRSIGEVPLQLRVGINTGEALVRLGVSATSGEGFLSGDAINTASRIQSVAPEMGVAVGLATYEATSIAFDYQELESATLKGKSEPVRVFRAMAPRARLGTDLTRIPATPFIGREIDLALLKGLFDKTLAAASPQLVTVVGEPGLGKSRIVAELGAYIEAKPQLVTWRQGRCLPYGDGITFWALGEILKAHTGILESDAPEVALSKLDLVLPHGTEREWFRQRLMPLLGIEATSTAERDEMFTAWRRFLEHIAEQAPTVLVFEDLHWADAAMLEFLEHLADRAEGVPLMIVGTARPELFERHAGYARSLRNATPITLAPLMTDEIARLLSALLENSIVSDELQTPILERAEGNPLFAEEFVRLLKDRGLLVRRSSWELTPDTEMPLPDSIQSLLAARLDTLSPERKAMLADAAVVGKVFWAGAIAAMGELEEALVIDSMRELSRKELIRPARRSSMEGESEFAFAHVLARDVAYHRLPRAARSYRHIAAAAWLESKSSGRLEDLADVLAYHYTSALDLAKAAGQTEQANLLEAPARRFLMLAGERAFGLDTAAALDAFERALALTPAGDPARPEILARFGEVANRSGRLTDAASALDEAVSALLEQGKVFAAARAMDSLSWVLFRLNDPRGYQLDGDRLALLEGQPPGSELVEALAAVGNRETAFGNPEEGLLLADRAIAVASELGLARPSRAIGVRAFARCALGDADGLSDYRDALQLSLDARQLYEAGHLYNNLAVSLLAFEGPQAALDAYSEGLAFAEARGLGVWVSWMRMGAALELFVCGRIGEALAEVDFLAEHAEAADDEMNLIWIQSLRMVASTYRGDADDLGELCDRVEASARGIGRPDTILVGLGGVAIAMAARGEAGRAAALLDELDGTPNVGIGPEDPAYVVPLVRAAIAIGRPELADRLRGHLVPRSPFADHAVVAADAAIAEARVETETAVDGYADAAARWERFGVPPERGYALLGQGRCLLELSRALESAEVLQQAREVFATCGMRPALEETDALLSRATARTS